MRNKISLTTVIFFVALSLNAELPTFFKRIEFAPQLGTDFGAAVPFPFGNVPSGSKSISPSLNITPALRFAYRFDNQWAIGFDPAYKTVGMDIQAKVTNQKFNDNGRLAYFTGISDIYMRYGMFELPLYCRFTLPNQKNRFMLGYYVAFWTYKRFDIKARKGFIGSVPDHVESTVTGEGVDMEFTSYLRNMEHGLIAGYEHLFNDRLSAGVRLNIGINDIFQPNIEYFDYSFIPLRVGFMVSYRLY